MADLDSACAELLGWLPQVEELLAEHDEDGSTGGGQPTSAPPWNAQVANVALDVHEGARRLERELRAELTGHPGRHRGGAHEGTMTALKQIAIIGSQLGLDPAKVAAQIVERWNTAVRQLPAIDQSPVWRRLSADKNGMPPLCPYCQTFQLRAAVRERLVICFRPGCTDGDGNRPTATLDRLLAGPNAGMPVLLWADGLMQVAP